jgi:hypothetical protein
VKCEGSRLSSPLDAVDPDKTMRPKTTGNVLVFQLIGDSFHGGSWLGGCVEPIQLAGYGSDACYSSTIHKPAQLFRIVMANARSHEFFARVVN